MFWLAPLIGAAIAGLAYPYLFGGDEELADRPVRDDALEDTETGDYLTGAFFLALLAARLLGLRALVGQLTAGVLQVGADEPLELLQLAGVADEHVLR